MNPANPSQATLRARPFHWNEVESADYREYVANLHRIGCPPKTIADIITADVNQVFRLKASNLLERISATNKFEYWRSPSYYAAHPTPNVVYAQQLRELNRDRVDLLRLLLNESVPADDLDWAPPPPSDLERARALEFLPPEKRAKVTQISDEYNAKLRAAIKRGAGDPDAYQDVAMELQRIRNDGDRARSAVLTPDEENLVDLHYSQLAHGIRSDFDGLDLSEQEFQKIFALRQQLQNTQTPIIAGSSPEQIAAKLAAETETERQLIEVLGNDRYEESKRLQDRYYRNLLTFGEEHGNSKEAMVALYNLKAAAELDATRIRQENLSSEQARQERLRELRSQTEGAIKGLIGAPAAETLKRDRQGRWIRDLERIASPPAPNIRRVFIPAN